MRRSLAASIGTALVTLLAVAGLPLNLMAQKKAATGAAAPVDLKIRTKTTTNGQSFEHVT